MPMNPRLLRPLAGRSLLLDRYPGAGVAYSLRRLSSAYSGPVVKVRRSSDNEEADFTATEVSSDSLASWVGAGNDGFVRTWYDQSGNARDAGQTTSNRQPKIVSSGSLVLNANGKPALALDGSGLAPSNYQAYTGDYSFFSVAAADLTTLGGYALWDGGVGNNNLSYFRFDRINSRIVWLFNSGTLTSANILTQALQPVQVWSGVAAIGGPTGTAYRNGSQIVTGSPAEWSSRNSGLSLFSFGNGGGNQMAGNCSEFVWYTSQQSNRAAIETEMMKYYGIT